MSDSSVVDIKSRLLIKNKDGVLYAVVLEKWVYVRRNRAFNWQFYVIEYTSAQDSGEARFSVLNAHPNEKVRVVSAAPVIGVWGNEKTGIQI
jgi:hypothetical protein